MSDAIRQLQRDWEKAARAADAGLTRELRRQVLQPVRRAFTASFRLGQQYRAKPDSLPLDQYAIAEGADLAQDPDWDADRAWLHSEARKDVLLEIERRREKLTKGPRR